MTWFKVDDSFYDHPKVFDCPDAAVALWVRAGTWSARNLTEGFVPSRMPARLCDDPETAVRELLRRGLWLRTSGGYLFHDWTNYQPSKEAVEDLRVKRAEAGRKGGQAKAAKQKASNGLASARGLAKQNATPTRPDPSGTGGEEAHGPARASPEPPRTCPEHANTPDPPRCGRCADARRHHDTWQHEQLRADQARRSAAARDRAGTARAAIDSCRLCDQRGYLASGRQCSHDPARVSAAGAAAARAAITRTHPEESL